MVRFLADADFNHAVVRGCRRKEPSLDFMSANEAELNGLDDVEVLAVAAQRTEFWSRTTAKRCHLTSVGSS
jgi:hypothetical protein